MTIVEFLQARLDEDAETARKSAEWSGASWRAKPPRHDNEWAIVAGPDDDIVAGPGYEGGGVYGEPDVHHIARHDPARVLADVEAKRRIVERHNPCDGWGAGNEPCDDLRDLASAWASHPDYRAEWAV